LGLSESILTEESSVSGIYVAGDASRDVLLVAVAIAEGAIAAVAIGALLLDWLEFWKMAVVLLSPRSMGLWSIIEWRD
jgi:hypothetical protein